MTSKAIISWLSASSIVIKFDCETANMASFIKERKYLQKSMVWEFCELVSEAERWKIREESAALRI